MKQQVEDFVVSRLVPMGHRIVVTSRQEGVRLRLWAERCVIMNLAKLSEAQQKAAIEAQLVKISNNPFTKPKFADDEPESSPKIVKLVETVEKLLGEVRDHVLAAGGHRRLRLRLSEV